MGRETTYRQVFVGSDGLRAGWAAAVFLVVYLSLDSIVGRLLDQLPGLASGRACSAPHGVDPRGDRTGGRSRINMGDV